MICQKEESKAKIISGLLCSILMLVCVATYLLLGFFLNLWHPYWIIIVCGGLLCGIIGSITDAVEKLNNLKKKEETNEKVEVIIEEKEK